VWGAHVLVPYRVEVDLVMGRGRSCQSDCGGSQGVECMAVVVHGLCWVITVCLAKLTCSLTLLPVTSCGASIGLATQA
jgi:hypothetical protein